MAVKPIGAKTVEEYLSKIDQPRQSEVRALHGLISKAVPKLKSSIQAGMIGYGSYHQKGLSGESDWPVIALASQKSYISVYVAGTAKSGCLPEIHRQELKGASIGKCCIRFKKVSSVDLKALEKVVKLSAKAMQQVGYQVEAVREVKAAGR